jgi:dihydrolipoamide dehydrogenase
MATDFDVVVIGSGPGGYVAAIRASQLGMKAAIVEREDLGGVCLNWGCIPTKALLKSAEVFEKLGQLEEYGLTVTSATFDFSKVMKRSRAVAQKLSSGVAFLMKKHKIEVMHGTARLEKAAAAPKVVIDLNSGGVRSVTAKHVILATGARARVVPIAGMVPDGVRIWSYREALSAPKVPKTLIVSGSGAIGIEFASFFRALGAEVTVVEALPRILPLEDAEISTAAQKAFEKRGLKFVLGANVSNLTSSDDGVVVNLQKDGKKEILRAEQAIIAIGIEGNVENMGLEKLAVQIERGHVVTSSFGKTNLAGLYAIGDVAGPPWLAHKASHEGVHCVEHLAGKAVSGLTSPVPSCTYADPQVASVGISESQAKQRGYEVRIGRFPFRVNGKAIASGETAGFVKTVFDAKTGALLGAHMIGSEVTELIQGYALAMTLEATEEELFATIYPHPTLSEVMHEASLDAYGMAIHI